MKTKLFIFSFILTSTITFSQNTVKASEIIASIKNSEAVSYKNATIVGDIDFTFMEEKLKNLPKKQKWFKNGENNSNSIKETIKNDISFINCTFENDVLAYIHQEKSNYTFIANFDERVSFKGCTFKGKAMFKYSNFKKDSDFSNTTFKDISTFKYANFKENNTFLNAKFEDDTSFKYAKFNKDGNFKNNIFNKSSSFKYTEFNKNISFEDAIFEESAVFKYTKFKDGVSFKNVNFKKDLDLKYASVKGDFNITNMKVVHDIDSKYTKINGKSFSKYLLK